MKKYLATFLLALCAYPALCLAGKDPLNDEFYEKPGSSISRKMDRIIDLAEQGLEKATPLAEIETELAVQGKEQEWLKKEYEYNKDFRDRQVEINQSIASTMKFCVEAVKDLTGRWNTVYGLIVGLIIALVPWYLDNKKRKSKKEKDK